MESSSLGLWKRAMCISMSRQFWTSDSSLWLRCSANWLINIILPESALESVDQRIHLGPPKCVCFCYTSFSRVEAADLILWPVHSLSHWGRDEMDNVCAEDIFKCIFFNGNVWISIKISLKFVPEGEINSIPALVQRQWLGAVQATSHHLNQWWLVYRR